jgi:hypothetical protein
MMKRRTTPSCLALAIGAVLAIVLAIWRMLPRDTQLLERARRVASTSDWSSVPNPNEPGHPYYFWLNQAELLHFRDAADDFHGFRLTMDGSHADIEIPGLRIPRSSTLAGISSDGRLLLWFKADGSPNYVHPRVSVLDGPSDRRSASRISSFPVLFGPLLSFPTLSLRRQRFRAVVTGRGQHYQILGGDDGRGHDLAVYHELAPEHFVIDDEPLFDASDWIFAAERFAGSQTASGVPEATNEYGVHYIVPNGDEPWIEHTVRIDRGKRVANVCPSPDGNRIFFEEISERKDPMPDWVYKWIPSHGPRDHNERRVFVVADIKTGKRKELAAYEAPYPVYNHSPQLYVQDVKWAPDGNRLSFIFQQNLYTIPAD